ncbi:hypothetical protein HK104_010934 [Borealophlyctis nickersoniae]|nr:hypothetical protein HK104_010934 [Borealophlyctis nickersoniae]
MEVPVDVRDGIEDGEHTDSMTPPIVVVEPPRGASPIPGDEDEDAVPSTDSELRPDDDDTSPHDPDEILNLPPLDDLPPTSMTPPPSSRPAPPTSFTRRVSSLLDFRTMFGPVYE